MTKRALPLALLLLAGCQTISPEAKVRTRLVEAGVRPRMAQCMAERLVDRLSIAQLQKLGQAARVAQQGPGKLTIDELVHRLRGIGDPEIVEVATRAGVGCFIAG